MCPASSTIGLLDTQTYTLATIDISTQAAAATTTIFSLFGSWSGCTLTASGKVVCMPGSIVNPGIFDPIANTFTLGTILSPNQPLCGGVLLHTDEVLGVPLYLSSSPSPNQLTIPIYNYNTDTFRNVVVSFPYTAGENVGFQGGAVMPDGTVVLAPSSGAPEYIGLFNQFTNTISYIKTTVNMPIGTPYSKEFFGASLLMDGRMLLCPSQAGGAGVSFIFITQTLPATKEMCLHPFFNKL